MAENFRTDINGLRAIAVVSVVLYHFMVPGFGGGYVGVNVFFVISGFLMTQVITRKLFQNRFSIADFYAARARRIVPALLALNTVLIVFGFWLLLPLAYKALSKSIATSTGFVSNVAFWRERGYFDAPSQQKWLLHTWSLSVEWQFYLVFPLFLVALQRFKSGRFLRHGILIAIAISLALCIAVTPGKPAAAFFLLPTRAWEMLAGGLVYLAGERSRVRFGTPLGLALILAASVLYDADLPYPGYRAIAPVLGAALIIAARNETPILGNRVAQFLGNVSYSLYLWHWPFVVGARYFHFELSAGVIVLLIGLSLLAAYASYRVIEIPGKRIGVRIATSAYLTRCFAACCALIVAAGIVVELHGVPQRVPAAVAQNDAVGADWQYPGRCQPAGPFCKLGADSAQRVLFWGDSNMEQFYPALAAIFEQRLNGGFQALMGTKDGCLPVRGIDKIRGNPCHAFNQTVFERALEDDVKVVVLGSIWAPYFRQRLYDETSLPTICEVGADNCRSFASAQPALDFVQRRLILDIEALAARGKRIYLILPIPAYEQNVASYMAQQLWSSRPVDIHLATRDHVRVTAQIANVLQEAARKTGAITIDPAKILCPGDSCMFEQHGVSIYMDNSHLATQGARLLVPALRPIFD